MSWFTDLFEKKEEPKDLKTVFIEVVQERQQELRRNRELLDDAKLARLIRKTIKYLVTEMSKKDDKYSFVLIHDSSVGLDTDVFNTYCKIFRGVCKELDITVEIESSYMKVEKRDMQRAFDKITQGGIDIDERTRAMLSQGIYR